MSATRVIRSWHTSISPGYTEPCFEVQVYILRDDEWRTLAVFDLEHRQSAFNYAYQRSKEEPDLHLMRSYENGIDTTPPDEEDFDA